MVVYILYSTSKNRFYASITQDINDRLERHNTGRVKSTKYEVPWKLIHKIDVEDRSAAMILEKQIKRRGIKRWLIDHLPFYIGGRQASSLTSPTKKSLQNSVSFFCWQ